MHRLAALNRRRHPRHRTALFGIVGLALAINAGFGWLVGRATDEPLLAAHSGSSEGLVVAAGTGDGRVLAATAANDLLLLEEGHPERRASLGSLIGGVVVTPDGGHTYAGTADGRVVSLDEHLKTLAEFAVEGRVVGLATTADGGLVVAHGEGAYGGRFHVSLFREGAGIIATTPLGVPVTAVASAGGSAFYGTLNSRVGRVGLEDGAVGWTVLLSAPVTRLLALPDGGALVGGEEGTLTRLDALGEIRWRSTVGQYPVRALAFDADTGTILAGDARGDVHVIDDDGRIGLSRRAAEADIEALLPRGDGTLLVVPREGGWRTFHPAAVAAVGLADRLRWAWYATDAALVAALLAAAIATVDRLRAATRRGLSAAWRARLAYAFLLPALGLILFFSYYPAGMAFYYSLTNFSLRSATEFVGLRNYSDVLTEDRYFRTGVVNMVIIVATSVLKTISVPLLAAELVFWLRNAPHQYVYRTLFVLPAVVPDLVFTLMWRQVYDPYTGLLNRLLGSVGLSEWQRAWLGDEGTALWAVIGVGFPFIGAFAFLIFLGGLLSINRDYFDAARVDGAGRWARFWHIDVPLLLPQFRILLFFAITGTVQGFAAIFVLTRGGPGTATYVPALQMYRRIGEGDFGYASAVGVVLFVVILALTFVVLRFRRRDALELS